MDSDRLRQIMAAYGGHPDRWPDDERDAALALLHDRPELLDLQRNELSLDDALDGWQETKPSDDLISVVLPQAKMAASLTVGFESAEPVGFAGMLDQLIDGLRGWLVHPIAATAVACSIAAAGFSVGLVVPQETIDDSLLASDVTELILPGSDLSGIQ